MVNLSFGAFHGDADHCLHKLFEHMAQQGIAVVASAGNDGSCRHTYPAAYASVIGVGALGPDGPAEFSNYGSWVDMWAEGVDLLSTFLPWDGRREHPLSRSTVPDGVQMETERRRGPQGPVAVEAVDVYAGDVCHSSRVAAATDDPASMADNGIVQPHNQERFPCASTTGLPTTATVPMR